MRVITGSARGRRLTTLPGEDVIRPTGDKVKGAMFNSIQFDVPGRQVLDLFAGSGQLGIEALSRGAAHCVFVELNRDAVGVIRQNLAHCGLEENAQVLQREAVSFLKTARQTYDIILMDPPYGRSLAQQALEPALARLNPGGVLLCEVGVDEELPQTVGQYEKVKDSTYSKTRLCIYREGEALFQ